MQRSLFTILGIGLISLCFSAQRIVLCEEFYQET